MYKNHQNTIVANDVNIMGCAKGCKMCTLCSEQNTELLLEMTKLAFQKKFIYRAMR